MKRATFIITSLLISIGCQYQTEITIESEHQNVNGTEIFVKTMGSVEPILIVHGGPGLSHDYFLPHLEALAKTINSSSMINGFQVLLQ